MKLGEDYWTFWKNWWTTNFAKPNTSRKIKSILDKKGLSTFPEWDDFSIIWEDTLDFLFKTLKLLEGNEKRLYLEYLENEILKNNTVENVEFLLLRTIFLEVFIELWEYEFVFWKLFEIFTDISQINIHVLSKIRALFKDKDKDKFISENRFFKEFTEKLWITEVVKKKKKK